MSDTTAEARGITFRALCDFALALPGVEEGTSYGTPALRVKGKFFIRLKEDGESIVLKTDFYEREHLMAAHPEAFFITDHYRDYPPCSFAWPPSARRTCARWSSTRGAAQRRRSWSTRTTAPGADRRRSIRRSRSPSATSADPSVTPRCLGTRLAAPRGHAPLTFRGASVSSGRKGGTAYTTR